MEPDQEQQLRDCHAMNMELETRINELELENNELKDANDALQEQIDKRIDDDDVPIDDSPSRATWLFVCPQCQATWTRIPHGNEIGAPHENCTCGTDVKAGC